MFRARPRLLCAARREGASGLARAIARERCGPPCGIPQATARDLGRPAAEEIFGPILPLIPYRTLETVVGRINGAPKPLAIRIWSREHSTAQRLIERASAGGTCMNHAAAQFLHHNLPFGGVNHSGNGSYHGG